MKFNYEVLRQRRKSIVALTSVVNICENSNKQVMEAGNHDILS
jgi:hypothetical protein